MTRFEKAMPISAILGSGSRLGRVRLRAQAPRVLTACFLGFFLLTLGSGAALAQREPVLVDLSVIEGAGSAFGAQPAFEAPLQEGGLLLPPRRMPVSRLHVRRAPGAPFAASDDERIKLTPPSKRPKRKRRARRKARKRAPVRTVTRPARTGKAAKKPAKKPAREKVAKAPEKPAIPLKPAAPAAAKKGAPGAPLPPPAAAPPPPAKPPAAAAPPPPPAVAAPSPAKAPASPSKKTELAARPPAPEKKDPGLAIAFREGATKLTSAHKKTLDGLVGKLKSDKGLRLQLLAYAGGAALSPSKARHLSLSRALTVRSHLIGKGIRGTRIDVRALGNKVPPGGQPNRVELSLIRR